MNLILDAATQVVLLLKQACGLLMWSLGGDRIGHSCAGGRKCTLSTLSPFLLFKFCVVKTISDTIFAWFYQVSWYLDFCLLFSLSHAPFYERCVLNCYPVTQQAVDFIAVISVWSRPLLIGGQPSICPSQPLAAKPEVISIGVASLFCVYWCPQLDSRRRGSRGEPPQHNLILDLLQVLEGCRCCGFWVL